MRKLSKILALVLVLMMTFAVLSAFSFSASAATPEKLYLTPNANWKSDNARFAAYFFGNGEKWVSMTYNSSLGVYEVTVPSGYPNVIFCRMNPGTTANNWNNKWNQTADLTVPTTGPNHYTVKEGTWDKGGGTWSTLGSTCVHANLSAAATCTTAQTCLDCGDPVVSALGHTYNSAHLCTRCNEQASFTVAGTGAHLGTEWDTGNTANDMTYADGVYTKVYTNVAAGSYLLKVARDHDWGTAYPGSDKAYTVSAAGSTVTVTLKGTAVTVTVEAPHTHSWSEATCTEPAKCECGETQGEALGHDHVYGVCSRCGNIADGWAEVKTLEELNAALLNGGNIVLGANIESADLLNIVANTVINGNGNTLTYTGANRVIDVKKDYVDVDLTIVNLTINTTASFVERGINYNTNGALTLDNVTVEGTNINYAINLPSSSNDATVNIANSNITGNIALNVWGQNIVVTATNTNFVSPYVSDVEVCPVIKLNNNGTVAAHGTSVTVDGGSIVSADTNYGVAVSVSASDTSITISDETTVEGLMTTPSILIKYEGQNELYSSTSLQSAINRAANNPKATVVLIGDIVLDAPIVVEGTVVLDLNGYTLSYESTTQGEAMITNKGNLTINDTVGTGVINYNYVGANDASYGKGNYTISNAGTLTVNGGKITIANLRQHAKYPIDNNSTTGDAILVINGGHLYNYNTSAIRMFCNSTTNKNSVTINGGLIEGYSAIWMQNPGTKTVNGDLTITGGEIRTTAAAYVNGTATVKEVSSKMYTTIDGNGGAWSESSFVNLAGGTFNENVNLYYNAPANVTISDEAVFNGNLLFVCEHDWVDATCTAPKTCSVCGETDGEALGHALVTDAAVEATCTATGLTAGEHCTRCDYKLAQEVVPALGHALVTDVAVEATCTATGLTAGEHCTRCDYKVAQEVVPALGHAWSNCVCTVCETALSALGQTDAFDFTTEDGLNAALASGKLGYTGTFRNNGDSHQFAADSSIQLVVPANTTVTLTGHSTGYGVFDVYVNGVKYDMAGSLVFTTTEETKVVIVPDEEATYSKAYLKGIALAEYVDRTITSDTTITFGSEGNYKDSLVDFSGIQIGDNGGSNSQVKNGSFDLLLKAGTKVVIHGYPGYTSYQLNGGDEITGEYYTYLALEDTVLTVTPVNGNNYFYSIEITLHTGITLVEAVDSTCKVAGHEAYYSCECHGELTEKVARELAAHTEEVLEAVAPTCTSTGLTAGKKCSACGDVLEAQEEVAKLEHTYEAVVTAPTCTEAGYTTYTCACGDTYTGDEVAAPGHTYFYNLCLVCYAANPYFENNFTTVGENKLVCNEWHLVESDGGHGKPYQFTFVTIPEDGLYIFTADATK
ncbi:MAG: hypothetical protein IKA84_06385, partial [Clostridia bacterium]|nr:hypothetical protein [Clostridia bacterium]